MTTLRLRLPAEPAAIRPTSSAAAFRSATEAGRRGDVDGPPRRADERYLLTDRACQNLARLVDLKNITDALLLPPSLCEGYRSSSGDLVVQPAVDLQPARFQKAVRETRIDLLLIETALSQGRDPRFVFTALLPRRGAISEHRGMRLWLDCSGKPHLVPDTQDECEARRCFFVGQWLRDVATPWTRETPLEPGLERADALLLQGARGADQRRG